MPQPDFSDVQILLLEPDQSARLVRSSLAAMGFRKIMRGDPATPDLAILELTPVDLILAHATAEETAGFDLIQRIRTRRFRTNPFVGALVTTWAPTPAVIARAGASGADGVLAKPFSMASLRDVVEKFVDAPRPWVASYGYVGPDRRRDRPVPSGAPLLEVPNTVRAKALGQSMADVADRIDGAWRDVAAMRLTSAARFACDTLRAVAGNAHEPAEIARLRRVADAMDEIVRSASPMDDPRVTRVAGELAAVLRTALRRSRRIETSVTAGIALAELLSSIINDPAGFVAAPAEAGAA
jgi:CheY-like chemotaxis protein